MSKFIPVGYAYKDKGHLSFYSSQMACHGPIILYLLFRSNRPKIYCSSRAAV